MKPNPTYDPDPQNAPVIGYCEACGGEIYKDNEWYEHDGNMIHSDCVKTYAIDQITELTTKEVAELMEMKIGE